MYGFKRLKKVNEAKVAISQKSIGNLVPRSPESSTDTPSEYDWVEIDYKYNFSLFSGRQLPTSINEIAIQLEEGTFFHNFI